MPDSGALQKSVLMLPVASVRLISAVLSRCFVGKAAGIVLSPNALMVRGQRSPKLFCLLFRSALPEESCFSAITEQSVLNYSISRGV